MKKSLRLDLPSTSLVLGAFTSHPVFQCQKTQVLGSLCPGRIHQDGIQSSSYTPQCHVLPNLNKTYKGETAQSLGIKYRKATGTKGANLKVKLLPRSLPAEAPSGQGWDSGEASAAHWRQSSGRHLFAGLRACLHTFWGLSACLPHSSTRTSTFWKSGFIFSFRKQGQCLTAVLP